MGAAEAAGHRGAARSPLLLLFPSAAWSLNAWCVVFEAVAVLRESLPAPWQPPGAVALAAAPWGSAAASAAALAAGALLLPLLRSGRGGGRGGYEVGGAAEALVPLLWAASALSPRAARGCVALAALALLCAAGARAEWLSLPSKAGRPHWAALGGLALALVGLAAWRLAALAAAPLAPPGAPPAAPLLDLGGRAAVGGLGAAAAAALAHNSWMESRLPVEGASDERLAEPHAASTSAGQACCAGSDESRPAESRDAAGASAGDAGLAEPHDAGKPEADVAPPEEKEDPEESGDFLEALRFAVKEHSLACARQLLRARRGASSTALAAKDDDGHTALHLAALGTPSDAVLGMTSFLLAEGADPAVENMLGETPLLLAVRAALAAPGDRSPGAAAPCLRTVRRLLDGRAPVDAVDRLNGETPLVEAACHGSAPMCRLLLEFRADPGREMHNGVTALNFAADAEVERLLREAAGLACERREEPGSPAAASPRPLGGPAAERPPDMPAAEAAEEAEGADAEVQGSARADQARRESEGGPASDSSGRSRSASRSPSQASRESESADDAANGAAGRRGSVASEARVHIGRPNGALPTAGGLGLGAARFGAGYVPRPGAGAPAPPFGGAPGRAAFAGRPPVRFGFSGSAPGTGFPQHVPRSGPGISFAPRAPGAGLGAAGRFGPSMAATGFRPPPVFCGMPGGLPGGLPSGLPRAPPRASAEADPWADPKGIPGRARPSAGGAAGGAARAAGAGAGAPAAERHYRALGLGPGARADEVRRAYRRLALQHHPDKNADRPGSAEQFRMVKEAYEAICQHLGRAS